MTRVDAQGWQVCDLSRIEDVLPPTTHETADRAAESSSVTSGEVVEVESHDQGSQLDSQKRRRIE